MYYACLILVCCVHSVLIAQAWNARALCFMALTQHQRHLMLAYWSVAVDSSPPTMSWVYSCMGMPGYLSGGVPCSSVCFPCLSNVYSIWLSLRVCFYNMCFNGAGYPWMSCLFVFVWCMLHIIFKVSVLWKRVQFSLGLIWPIIGLGMVEWVHVSFDCSHVCIMITV